MTFDHTASILDDLKIALNGLPVQIRMVEDFSSTAPTPDVLIINVVPTGFGKLPLEECKQVFLDTDLWITKRSICLSRIKSLLKISHRIHGRETKLTTIPKQTYEAFLKRNHLLGSTGAKKRYALTHGSSVIAVAGTSKPRKILRDEKTFTSIELIRFCQTKGYTVIGGLSKLLQAMLDTQAPDDIMTYIDRMWPIGDGYSKFGFQFQNNTDELFLWLDPSTLVRHWPAQVLGDVPKNWLKVWNRGSSKLLCFADQHA